MLLVNSFRNTRHCLAAGQCLLGRGFSSTSDDKVRKVWTVTHKGIAYQASSRDFVVRSLSDDENGTASHQQLIKMLKAIPEIDEEADRIKKAEGFMERHESYALALIRSDEEVVRRVSMFQSSEKSEHAVCRASSTAWRTLLDKMSGIVGIVQMRFSPSSYQALLFELMKTERVKVLSLSGSSVVGQGVDESVHQLMGMFEAKEKLDFGLENLQFLSLGFMGVGNEGCEHISDAFQSGVLRNVRSLTLHGNRIESVAAERLCKEAVKQDNAIIELDLCLNHIGPVGVRRVQGVALAKPDLEVGLSGNGFWADS